MVNRYLLACILSTCYLSNEVMASNYLKKKDSSDKQQPPQLRQLLMSISR